MTTNQSKISILASFIALSPPLVPTVHGHSGTDMKVSFQLLWGGGMTDQTGVRDGPMFSSIPMASLGASMLALQGVLASLHVRNICGIGQKIETSMYQGAIAIRSPMLIEADEISKFKTNNLLPQGGLPSYRMYPCEDGKWLHIGCLTREFWDKLAVALDLLDLAIQPEFEAAPSGWSTDHDRESAIDLIADRLLEAPSGSLALGLGRGGCPGCSSIDYPAVHGYSTGASQ